MPVNEVRVAAEGELRYSQASGFSGAWTTASAPVTGLIGFCEELRMAHPLATFLPIRDRGALSHFKRTDDGGPYSWEFRASLVNTASVWWLNVASINATASGASIRKVHLEYKAAVPEHGTGAGTGIYFHLHHGHIEDASFDEGDPTVMRLRFVGWSADVATATSYLAV